ncbi:MAG TPA: hypothetical protein VFX60_02105 [Micromonospora sp.]|nr:hypothetical protein [Micromonospora sp.]
MEPWFADRIGAGLWLDGKNRPYGLMTLAVDDEAAASTGLAELQRKKGAKKFGFVLRKDYALVTVGNEAAQDAVEAAAAEADRETLAAAGQFRRGLEWLPARQTALAWIDLGKLGAMVKAMMDTALDGLEEDLDAEMPFGRVGLSGGLFPGMGGLTQDDDLKGQLILGARAANNGVEIRFRGFDIPAPAPAGTTDARSAVDALPADSAIAGSLRVGDIGEALANEMLGTTAPLPEEMFEGMPPAEAEEVRKQLQESRDKMQAIAEAFAAVSGAKLTLSVTKHDDLGFLVAGETTSAENATTLARSLEMLGEDGDVTVTASGNKVELKSKGYAAGGGSLGGEALYRQALEGAPEQANVVFYVDVQRLLADAGLTSEERAQVKPVKAIGLAAGLDGQDQVGLLRIVIE